jgi:hypothetical protein
LKSGIREKSRLLTDSEQLIQVLEIMKGKDPRVKFAYEFTEEVKQKNLERVLIITG